MINSSSYSTPQNNEKTRTDADEHISPALVQEKKLWMNLFTYSIYIMMFLFTGSEIHYIYILDDRYFSNNV
jgi:hypothetical protein